MDPLGYAPVCYVPLLWALWGGEIFWAAVSDVDTRHFDIGFWSEIGLDSSPGALDPDSGRSRRPGSIREGPGARNGPPEAENGPNAESPTFRRRKPQPWVEDLAHDPAHDALLGKTARRGPRRVGVDRAEHQTSKGPTRPQHRTEVVHGPGATKK